MQKEHQDFEIQIFGCGDALFLLCFSTFNYHIIAK